MEKEKMVAVFKAFSDVSRVEILALLKEGELCGNDILEKLKIGQSTLSHHMKILCESGIVNGRKVGKWTYYSISEDGGIKAKALLDEILDAKTTKAERKAVAPMEKAASKKTVSKKISKKSELEKKEEAPQPQKTKRRQMDSWLL